MVVVPRTWVKGTPRGYGDSKVASEWIAELRAGLAQFEGVGTQHDSETVRYEVILEFRVYPGSAKYRGQNMPHGTDLDNLVKQTVDGLASTKSKSLSPGLGIIAEDKAVYRITASKDLVPDDEETGVWVCVQSR